MGRDGSFKTIDSLMRHLRNSHAISIGGSTQKRNLKNVGYFHGFKGYRYITTPRNKIPFNNFNEVMALNRFDMNLKSLFYGQIMFIETALKNYAAEIVMHECNSSSFNDIYNKLLTAYKDYPSNSDTYKQLYLLRCKVRDDTHSMLSFNYSKNTASVRHYYNSDRPVPIWAIFEVISMGKFGNFIKALNISTKQQIVDKLSLNPCNCKIKSKNRLIVDVIFTLNSLRNAIAHNHVIFDVSRFSEPKNIRTDFKYCISQNTGVDDITFESILDYLMLIVYLLKGLRISKTELNRIIREFEKCIEAFRADFRLNEYNYIVRTNTRTKLAQLKAFVKKS